MESKNTKKVFISGCFDCFHSGHAEFIRQAAEHGDVYIALGTDENVKLLKEVKPTFNHHERKFILENIKGVKKVLLESGKGKLAFENELKQIKPDIFIVNEDGHSKEKQELCEKLGIEYKVLKRKPAKGLPERSSTEMRARNAEIPNRISIAGGWLDQPYVSEKYPGPNLTISIEPTHTFNFRSGIASSTRNKAIKLWGNSLPKGDPIHLAKILFSFDNPPGTPKEEIAGAQDSIGIAVPGLAYAYYDGEYCPKEFNQILDEDILSWLERKIYLAELKPREAGYSVFDNCKITKENAKLLSDAAEKCYSAILNKDFEKFAQSFTESFNAQTTLFPATFPDWIKPIIEEYKKKGAKGWKLSGAGGGGYLVLICEKQIPGTIPVKIRRK